MGLNAALVVLELIPYRHLGRTNGIIGSDLPEEGQRIPGIALLFISLPDPVDRDWGCFYHLRRPRTARSGTGLTSSISFGLDRPCCDVKDQGL